VHQGDARFETRGLHSLCGPVMARVLAVIKREEVRTTHTGKSKGPLNLQGICYFTVKRHVNSKAAILGSPDLRKVRMPKKGTTESGNMVAICMQEKDRLRHRADSDIYHYQMDV
jgi:hypothetical protein